MKHVRSLTFVLIALLVLLAGCGRPAGPTLSSLSASPAKLPSAGGPASLTWNGDAATDYQLTLDPGTGVLVDGRAYHGSVDLATTSHAGIVLPGNAAAKARTYTATLTATGYTGTTTAHKTATLTVAAAAPTITGLAASKATLPSNGGSTTLTWSGSAVTDYHLRVSTTSGVSVNGTPYQGSVDLHSATTATVSLPGNASGGGVRYTLTLTADGAKGTTAATRSLSVTVGASTPAIALFSASPAVLPASGGSTSLTWNGSAVTDYQLSVSPSAGVTVNGQAYAGSVDLQTTASAAVTLPGNDATQPVAYTLTLTAVGAPGTAPASKSTTLTVAAADPSISGFTANPVTLTANGGKASLAWSGSAVTDYQLSVSPSAGVTIDGTSYTVPVDLNTVTHATVALPYNVTTSDAVYTFTLTAKGGPGTTTARDTSTVTVRGHSVSVYSGPVNGFSNASSIAVDPKTGLVAVANDNHTVGLLLGPNANYQYTQLTQSNAGVIDPRSVAFDANGNLWISDGSAGSGGNGAVIEMPYGYFALQGLVSLKTFQGSPYNFDFPDGITVDRSGNVWVANEYANAVVELPAGAYTTAHTYGAGAASSPFAIATDSQGNVWVIGTNGKAGELPANQRASVQTFYAGADPYSIAIGPWDNVWIANYVANSVTELPKGQYGSPVTFKGSAYAFDYPTGIAVDGSGNVWVANSAGNSVTELPHGAYDAPRVFARPDYPFNGTEAITVDSHDNVWVAGDSVVELH